MPPYAYFVICFLSFSASACASWTMVVLPDTQGYMTAEHYPGFLAQTEWIVDNKNVRNIKMVLHEGDITNHNTPDEWRMARNAIRVLDGHVPYTMVIGNHDIFPTPPFDRDQHLLNDYFALTDNRLNSITTEKNAGDLANTYSRFIAPDGRKILVLSLEYVPRPEVLAWAGEICDKFPDHTVVVLVHANVQEGPAVNGEPTTNRHTLGNTLWNKLTGQHKNIEIVLNGHHPDGNDTDPHGPLTTARQSTLGKYGNVVHEIGFNSQQQPNGGNGYLRLLEFLDDGITVQVRTYSPTLDVWLTSARNEFPIKLSGLSPAVTDKAPDDKAPNDKAP